MGVMKAFQMDLVDAEDLYERVAEMVGNGAASPAWVRVIAERANAVLSQPAERIAWPELRLIQQALYEALIGAERVSRAVKAEERRIRKMFAGHRTSVGLTLPPAEPDDDHVPF